MAIPMKLLQSFTLTLLLFSLLSPLSAMPQKAPVMLAQAWDKKTDIRGWWISEKFDGVRGYWTGTQLLTRGGHLIAAPTWFTEHFPSTPLDGELWLGRGQFSVVSGIVRSQHADAQWQHIRYLVFDAPKVKGGFEKRLAFARQWFKKHANAYVQVIAQQQCQNKRQLEQQLKAIEAKRGEGLMLRRPNSPYTIGRSADLLKVKSYQDMEVTVTGHLPGKGKHQGRLGALQALLPDGRKFAIGTGFSDQERENPPPIGSLITIRYFGLTQSGKPRFASFLRIRNKH